MRKTLKKGGYCTRQGKGPVTQVRYSCSAKMISGTQILCHEQGLPKLSEQPKLNMEVEYGKSITPIEKAETLALQGHRPATVSAASAYNAGGAFISGGRHALEEAFCSQTTLYASL